MLKFSNVFVAISNGIHGVMAQMVGSNGKVVNGLKEIPMFRMGLGTQVEETINYDQSNYKKGENRKWNM